MGGGLRPPYEWIPTFVGMGMEMRAGFKYARLNNILC